MRLSAFSAYCTYLAIKQHFTTTYDYFKYRGKVRATLENFSRRSDRFHYDRLSRKYDESEIVDFLVANFRTGESYWGGALLSEESHERYKMYLKQKQSQTYLFQEDLAKIGGLKGKFSGESPPIIKMYLHSEITLETLIILDIALNFRSVFNTRLAEDFEWPLINKKMEKLAPFLSIDQKRMKELIKKHEENLLNTA